MPTSFSPASPLILASTSLAWGDSRSGEYLRLLSLPGQALHGPVGRECEAEEALSHACPGDVPLDARQGPLFTHRPVYPCRLVSGPKTADAVRLSPSQRL